jgi:hypothetical protein
MQPDENTNKKGQQPAPIRVSWSAMDWLYARQEERRKATGKRPTFAEIIEDLILHSTAVPDGQTGVLSDFPDERSAKGLRNVVEKDNEPQAPVLSSLKEIQQSIESKGDIDYERIERTIIDARQAIIDALRRIDHDRLSRDANEIAGAEKKDRSVPARGRKGTSRPDRRRGVA